jgi:hypothetical protein
VSVLAIALCALAIGCKETVTKPVRFEVTSLAGTCKVNTCAEVTLQCINSVRATLLPLSGDPIFGPCTEASHSNVTLCEPTKLFSSPLFDQLDNERVGLRVEGFSNTLGTPGCQARDLAFVAETNAPIDLAAASAANMPIGMNASCNTACDPILNLVGEVLSWPPTPARDPPPVGTPRYTIDFGYAFSDPLVPASLVWKSLFPVSYDATDNTVAATGFYTTEAHSAFDLCIGYQTTFLPSGGTVTTQTCVDKGILQGPVQSADAFLVSPTIAEALGRAQPIGLNVGLGVLLGQVRKNMVGQAGATVSVSDFGGNDAGARLYYYTSSGDFAQAGPSDVTAAEGIFAVAGIVANGAGLVTVSASFQGRTSPALDRVILPHVATVFELDL